MNINCNSSIDATVNAQRLAMLNRAVAAAKRDSAAAPVAANAEQTTADPAPPESAQTASSTSATAGAAPTYGQHELDLVHQHWGQSGAEGDFNGDGTVDVNDLLQVINNWNQSTPPAAPPAVYGQDTLDLVGNNWGHAGGAGDINSDGAVDVNDLLFVTSHWGQPINQPGAQTPPPETPVSAPAESTAEAPVESPVAPQPAAVATNSEPTPSQVTTTPPGVRHLSKVLIERLHAAGFTDRPPSNIREILDKLNLSPGDRKGLLARLHEQYPRGLGVNLQA